MKCTTGAASSACMEWSTFSTLHGTHTGCRVLSAGRGYFQCFNASFISHGGKKRQAARAPFHFMRPDVSGSSSRGATDE